MPSAPTRTTPSLLALASLLVLAACSSDPASPTMAAPSDGSAAVSAGAAPSASAATVDSIDDRAEATLADVTGEPDWPLEGFGSMWALAPDQEEPAILRIDPATNEIVASVPFPDNVARASPSAMTRSGPA